MVYILRAIRHLLCATKRFVMMPTDQAAGSLSAKPMPVTFSPRLPSKLCGLQDVAPPQKRCSSRVHIGNGLVPLSSPCHFIDTSQESRLDPRSLLQLSSSSTRTKATTHGRRSSTRWRMLLLPMAYHLLPLYLYLGHHYWRRSMCGGLSLLCSRNNLVSSEPRLPGRA